MERNALSLHSTYSVAVFTRKSLFYAYRNQPAVALGGTARRKHRQALSSFVSDIVHKSNPAFSALFYSPFPVFPIIQPL